MRKIVHLLLVGLLSVSVIACANQNEAGSGSPNAANQGEKKKTLKIGVSLMTLQYPFFQDIRKGIEMQALASDVEIVNVNDAGLNLQTQVSALENFVAQGVDAIILNAVDPKGISQGLQAAEERNIPVITIDMKPSSGTFATYIGSDNSLGGELAGKAAIDYLSQFSGTKEVVIMSNPLSSSSKERVDGFKKAVSTVADINIVQEFGGATREDFMRGMEDILTAHPNVKLVYAYSGQGGLGSYDAIKAANKSDSVAVIGFDATAEEQELVYNGVNYIGSVIQFPEKLGNIAVQSAVDIVNGEQVPSDIPVEVGLFTKDGIKKAQDFDN